MNGYAHPFLPIFVKVGGIEWESYAENLEWTDPTTLSCPWFVKVGGIEWESYAEDADNREIPTSDRDPFQNRQMGTDELARVPKASCLK